LKLTCSKYRWDESDATEERNFFSDVSNPTLIDVIDLNECLVKGTLGDIEFTFENIDENNVLHGEASHFTFQCANIDNALQDFFEIYTNDNLFKWKLDFYDNNNELLHAAIIYRDGITFPERKDNVISISAIGYEKEFSDYYVNKPMLDASNFVNDPFIITLNGFQRYHFKSVLVKSFPKVYFGNTFVSDLDFLSYYYIVNKPYTYYPHDSFVNGENTIHIKTGYDAYYQDGVNRFNYFQSIFQSMGWVWFFFKGKMIIRKRSDTSAEVIELNHSESFIRHSVSNTFQNYQADTVIIEDGEYFDNGNKKLGGLTIPTTPESTKYNLAGRGKKVFSNNSYCNYQRPFRRIEIRGKNYQLQYGNWDFARLSPAADEETFEQISLPAFHPENYSVTRYTYPKFKTVRINPVVNSVENAGGFDINNPRADTGAYYGNGNFFYAANLPLTNTHILYTGNAGNSLINLNPTTVKFTNYEEYCQTETFNNNFKKFLRSSVQTIFQIEVKQLITNPFVNIKISNYPYYNLPNKTFSINTLAYNYISGVSKLTLQVL